MIFAVMIALSLAQVPVFQEDFNFGFTHDWRIADPKDVLGGSSNWFVRDGVLHQDSDVPKPDETNAPYLGSRFYLQEPSFKDGTLVARISSQDDDGIALLFRVQDESRYYRLFLLKDPKMGGPLISLDKRNGKKITVLARWNSPPPYPFGPWWNLAVEMNGSSFRAFMNGELLLDAKDGSYETGGIGISCWSNKGVRVDRLGFFLEGADSLDLKPRPALLKGPFIGCLEPRKFKLAWETSIPLPSSVEILDGDGSRIIESGEDDRIFHEILVDGLEPAAAYRYRVLSGPVQSPLYMVKTPTPGATSYKFCVYGDNRTNFDDHRLVIRAMTQKAPEFVLHVGDLVTHGSRYEEWLPEFFAPADWLIHTVPFYVAAGNHEDGGHWLRTFMPLPGNEKYYAFTQGTGFFVALDTNISLKPDSPQIQWLREVLDSKETKSAKWRFCFFHHPPYSMGKRHYDGEPDVRRYVLPLLEEGGFDIAFFGHIHDYERGKLNGVYHVVTGGGGAPLCFGPHYRVHEFPHVSTYRCMLHACLVEVEDDHLKFSAFMPNGKVFDAFEITK